MGDAELELEVAIRGRHLLELLLQVKDGAALGRVSLLDARKLVLLELDVPLKLHD